MSGSSWPLCGPDESECRTTCTNLAYADRDMQRISHELAEMEAAAADPLAPRPLRDRATARAERYRVIIERHHASRPRAGNARGSGIR